MSESKLAAFSEGIAFRLNNIDEPFNHDACDNSKHPDVWRRGWRGANYSLDKGNEWDAEKILNEYKWAAL